MARVGDIARGTGWELRCGDYRDVLADVECAAVITDPPYSARTHDGMQIAKTTTCGRAGVVYESWGSAEVDSFMDRWQDVRWVVCFTDHKLAPSYESASEEQERYAFQPLPFVELGKQPRLTGDGPASWTCWIMASRTKNLDASRWRSLPGAYVSRSSSHHDRLIKGGKPLSVMRAVVRDYSRRGDLVCDPCAGAGTTLLAAVSEGRTAIGAEINPATFDVAVARLRKGHTSSFDFGEETA